jgi:hypothetical protein
MALGKSLEAFIRTSFRSTWALEILCHLKSVAPRSLQQSDIVEVMRASNLVVKQSVEGLLAAGLIEVDGEGNARYAPRSPELGKLTAAAEALYARSPYKVRRIIVAAANPSITAFADAFKLKKKD